MRCALPYTVPSSLPPRPPTGDPSVEDVRDNFDAIIEMDEMDDVELSDSASMAGVQNVNDAAERGWKPTGGSKL